MHKLRFAQNTKELRPVIALGAPRNRSSTSNETNWTNKLRQEQAEKGWSLLHESVGLAKTMRLKQCWDLKILSPSRFELNRKINKDKTRHTQCIKSKVTIRK